MPKRFKHPNCRRLDKRVHLKPSGIPSSQFEQIDLFLHEFEAIRLCDYDGLSQIEAAEKMCISRGTVQRLLISGRKKIVDVILNLKSLNIDHSFNSRQ